MRCKWLSWQFLALSYNSHIIIAHRFALYIGFKKPLNIRLFPEWQGEVFSWESFKRDAVEMQGSNDYTSVIEFIEEYKERTLDKVDILHEKVIEKGYESENADIILTTCHCAKGSEWDTIFVCDDIMPKLNSYGKLIRNESEVIQNNWQFRLDGPDDQINLLYIALTRAKKMLFLPSTLTDVLSYFDKLISVKNPCNIDRNYHIETNKMLLK